jgi:hypothetical protein
MRADLIVGSVSFIQSEQNPLLSSVDAVAFTPMWVPATYIGLAATKNEPPPNTIMDFYSYSLGKDFRALACCNLEVDLDDNSGALLDVRVTGQMLNGGYTPAFRWYNWMLSLFSGSMSIYRSIIDRTAHPGEVSPISSVVVRRQHPRTSFVGIFPPPEEVVANILIKFRAGAITDNIGAQEVKSPFHVPWVWCETVITWNRHVFRLYGRGSIFPTHYWYFQQKRVALRREVSDAFFPTKRPPWGTGNKVPPTIRPPKDPVLGPWSPPPKTPPGPPKPPINEIDVQRLNLYPVLSKGAPASGPQTSLAAENGRAGPVDTHPNTVSGGPMVEVLGPTIGFPPPRPPPPPGPPQSVGIAGTWFLGTNTFSKRTFVKQDSTGYWVGTDYVNYGNPPTWREAGAITLREGQNGLYYMPYGNSPNTPRFRLSGGTLQELNTDGSPIYAPWHR